MKWPVGYEVNISRQGENFIQVDFDTPWCQPESNVVAELSRRFGCTLEHWYAEQGCNFCGWQRYERGELVDVLWGELEWLSLIHIWVTGAKSVRIPRHENAA